MFSPIDDHAVDRRLDSKGPGRQEQQAQAESSISCPSPRRSRSESRRTKVQRQTQRQAGRTDRECRAQARHRRAGTGRQVRKDRARGRGESSGRKNGHGRHRKDGSKGASRRVHPERNTRELDAGASRQSAERGRRGRIGRPVPERREAQAKRRWEAATGRIPKGVSPLRIESPMIRRPEGVGSRER